MPTEIDTTAVVTILLGLGASVVLITGAKVGLAGLMTAGRWIIAAILK